jgi:hypothetical protein
MVPFKSLRIDPIKVFASLASRFPVAGDNSEKHLISPALTLFTCFASDGLLPDFCYDLIISTLSFQQFIAG